MFFGYGTSPVAPAAQFTFGTPPTADRATPTRSVHDRTLTVGGGAPACWRTTSSNPAGRTLTAALGDPAGARHADAQRERLVHLPPGGRYTGPGHVHLHGQRRPLASDPATVTLTVTDQAPVAAGDSYKTGKGKTLTVAGRGVLANDTDADGDALTAAVVTQPANGTLTLNPNGSFTYTPNAGFTGTDTFTYVANDKALRLGPRDRDHRRGRPAAGEVGASFNDGSAQRSLIRSITITFDTLVTFDAGAFRLVRAGGTVAGADPDGHAGERRDSGGAHVQRARDVRPVAGGRELDAEGGQGPGPPGGLPAAVMEADAVTTSTGCSATRTATGRGRDRRDGVRRGLRADGRDVAGDVRLQPGRRRGRRRPESVQQAVWAKHLNGERSSFSRPMMT